ncbi:MAG: CvpA family protein [Anaerorhabdus sp.]
MKTKKILALTAITIVMFAVLFYIYLPALNIQTLNFYLFIGFVLFVPYLSSIISTIKLTQDQIGKSYQFSMSKNMPMAFRSFLAFILLIALISVGKIFFSPILASNSYANRIEVATGNFNEDIAPVDLSNLPLLDKESTERVGDRVMGQLPELISQFEVSNQYTQISYNGRLVRVTPLEYDGFFKWLGNRSDGSPGYIMVDSTTGEADLIKLDKGMKYLNSSYLNENINRHIRFQFPTEILSTSVFEIDDEGNPYYITPVLSVKWVDMLPDVKGVIATNPVDGKSQYYSVADAPTWIDHIYPSSLILSQVNDWGSFQDGWLNSFITQKNVRRTTTGYTYLSDSKDIFIYTGITSAAADESNIGFILTNLRSKETRFFAAPGAEEYSAMRSAEGAVQEKGYTSTFPLLINLNERPTYLSSLKDSAGLVKSYAFVDVEDYQKVKVSDSNLGLDNAANEYLMMMGNEVVDKPQVTQEQSGIINTISSVVVDGSTYYYIILENQTDTIYKAPINIDDRLPFLAVGTKVNFNYNENLVITSLESIEIPTEMPTE